MLILRLSLHVLAATIWVGGQFVLAGLVPTLRAIGDDAPRLAARRFNLIAWPAYFVLLMTGVWNLMARQAETGHPVNMALFSAKFGLYLLSGLGAFAHTRANGNKVILAVGGALAAVCAAAALVLGVAIS